MISKGEALAYSAYPHPALRPMGDLDILVREEQQDEAVRCLEGIGYREEHGTLGPMTGELGRQHHAHLSTKSPIPLVVEVHQNILDSQAFLLFETEYKLVLEEPGSGSDRRGFRYLFVEPHRSTIPPGKPPGFAAW